MSHFYRAFVLRGVILLMWRPTLGIVAWSSFTFTNNPAESPRALLFSSRPFTSNVAEFKSEMAKVELLNGGDEPEQSLAALFLAAQQPFRPTATKVTVLITDNYPRNPDADNPNFEATSRALLKGSISQLHLVVPTVLRDPYSKLHTGGIKGDFFAIESNRQEFDRILPKISTSVVSMLSNADIGCSPARFSSKVIFTSGLWTALLGVGVLLALLVGQNVYVRNQVRPRGFLIGSLASLLAGAVAGVAGEVIFGTVTGFIVSSLSGRIFTWSIFGALLGLVIALFVPNLKLFRAAFGSGIG
ncbi:MAG: hypothetical protein ACREEM_09345, partial [Blastocatellia bacterium]